MMTKKFLTAVILQAASLCVGACDTSASVSEETSATPSAEREKMKVPVCDEVPYPEANTGRNGTLAYYPCEQPYPYPEPEPQPQPQPFRPRSLDELFATAERLGVPPIMAGVPNIEQVLQTQAPPVIHPYSYPGNSTSPQDFVDRLFQSGTWQNPTPGPVVVTPQTGNPACTLTRVTAVSKPDLFVSSDAGGNYLYPGAINQGRFINMGVGALTPIQLPYTRRDPVYLSTTFYQSSISPTATLSDVNATIGQMLQTAPAQTNVSTYFRATSASSLEEAAQSFKLDVKVLGASASASLSQDTTRRENTVYAFFIQQLFSVRADLRGEQPIHALFNGTLSVADLEGRGNANELGYDNLPTYVASVTYGRLLIFSMTSSYSSDELKQTLELAYGENKATLNARQKRIIEQSRIQVFSHGGPFKPTADAIKDGSYTSFFNTTDIPVTTAQPIGYSVNLWDNQPGPMYRTTEYTTRNCAPIHDVVVELTKAYSTASVYLQKSNSGSEEHVFTTDEDQSASITERMTDGDDIIRIASQGDRKGFPPNWQRYVRVRVLVDGEEKFASTYECKYCHSNDSVVRLRVNRVTGNVTPL